MERRAARPRSVSHSETLDRLLRLGNNFAVVPYGMSSKKWDKRRIAKQSKQNEEMDRKKLIHEADSSIKGINFPAEEMAKVIRSWMKQDEA